MVTSTSGTKSKTETRHLELPSKILIVDDDQSVRRILSHSFSKHVQVAEAKNGRAGLELLHSEQPEFVITDLWMPVMTGIDFLREARRTFIGAGVPIMMLTSEGDEEALYQSFRYGVDDYRKKPFAVREIMLRVSSIYLRQARARDVNPLTRLPGNLMLKTEITERIQGPEPVAIAYLDLDNFKSFNDYQGFDRGDKVIELIADILKEFAAARDPGSVFLGHVGGDDFVMILPVEEIEVLANAVDTQFAEATRLLYSPDEWDRGYYEAVDRAGNLQKFPLVTVSTGVLTTARDGMDDLRRVAQVAAEVKKMAKAIPGNSLFVDRST